LAWWRTFCRSGNSTQKVTSLRYGQRSSAPRSRSYGWPLFAS